MSHRQGELLGAKGFHWVYIRQRILMGCKVALFARRMRLSR
jgi:hypothetical protein